MTPSMSVSVGESAAREAPATSRTSGDSERSERSQRATVRVRFEKLGKVRFTSHRDVARIWERALRRATVPVAYTQGFSPHPKLSFGLALSTGHESLGEYLDVDVVDSIDVEELPARLDPCLPVGIRVKAAAEIESGTPSLQEAVIACTWRIEVRGTDHDDLRRRIDDVLTSGTVMVTRTRKGRTVTDDVRPAIETIDVDEAPSASFVANLATQPRGLRPSELVAALGDDLSEGRVCRLHQWMSVDGARCEPLELAAFATPSTHAKERAS